MSNLIGKLYKWLYSKIGGKPWTDIIQEDQRNSPLLYMLIFLMLGIVVVKFCRNYWWQVLIAFGLGIVVGHFWF